MAIITCGMCRKKFESTESKTLPFCSVRCQQLDLGRWLGERYSMPVPRSEGDGEEETPPGEAEKD
jgi:endogenous inhibitor of DNA gyrase (YacG/DUF329 family)